MILCLFVALSLAANCSVVQQFDNATFDALVEFFRVNHGASWSDSSFWLGPGAQQNSRISH